MQYDVGDSALIEHTVTVDGVPTNATVTVTVTSPNGTVSNPLPSNPATGKYRIAVPVTLAGPWAGNLVISGPVDDVVPFQFAAAATAPPIYASLAELKEDRGVSKTDRDEVLLRRLQSASRAIDDKVGLPRRFWLDPTPTVRTYRTADRVVDTCDGQLLLVDDIGTDTGMVVEVGDGSTWSPVTDYELDFDNPLSRGWAVEGLLLPGGRWALGRRRVRVTARHGWPSIPEPIREATVLLANRLVLRKDAPNGIAASGEWGAIRVSRWDPDVEALVQPYILPAFA